MIAAFVKDVTFTGNIRDDAMTLLLHHGCSRTAEHSLCVAAEARRLARRWGQNETQAETAGWLHDVSAVVPAGQRVALAQALGLAVLPEERAFPLVIHQKLSVVFAEQAFSVTDRRVLDAIGCHTTLRAHATALDKIVFVADKIQWDHAEDPPYLAEIKEAAEQGLDRAVFCYLDYLWQQRHTLPVVHPWLVQAYQELRLAGTTRLR
jgi:predicted HD superfamily hydrolase involved in NAD metabolism